MSIQTIERLLANPFGVGRWMFSVDVQEKQMTEDVTADEVRRLLKLESAMCGFVRITFVTQRQMRPAVCCRRRSRTARRLRALLYGNA